MKNVIKHTKQKKPNRYFHPPKMTRAKKGKRYYLAFARVRRNVCRLCNVYGNVNWNAFPGGQFGNICQIPCKYAYSDSIIRLLGIFPCAFPSQHLPFFLKKSFFNYIFICAIICIITLFVLVIYPSTQHILGRINKKFFGEKTHIQAHAIRQFSVSLRHRQRYAGAGSHQFF